MAITFQVGFQADTKDLQKQFKDVFSTIQGEINNAFSTKSGLNDSMAQAVQQAEALKVALQKATTDKGLSFIQMKASLRESGTSAENMVRTLASAGPEFSKTFNIALTSLATANRNVIQISSHIKEMQRVMLQSVKFTAAHDIQYAFKRAVSEAIQWVQDLNTEVANIGVVTGKTGSQLDKVYQTIIEGSRAMRVSAKDYADAALIFYQQGLNDSQVEKRTQITIQAAKSANQSVETMSQQLTAIWNTYGMIGEEQARAASVGAKLAASTAVDFADISQAMQTSAAAAEQMGVSYNSLAAMIATVGDTTQQSASIIGNAYKTIFSRFQQLTTEGTDGEITLNAVSKKLQSLGINVLDASGKLRNLDSVIMTTGLSWKNYSEEQQLAIAELVGGTRQYGQFLALMNNFDKYLNLKDIAENEDGSTLVRQFISAQDTAEVAAERAQEAWSRAFGEIVSGQGIQEVYEAIESLGNAFGYVIDKIGGADTILKLFLATMTRMFSGEIANGIVKIGDTLGNMGTTAQQTQIGFETDAMRSSLAKRARDPDSKMDSYDVSIQSAQIDQYQKVATAMIDINQLATSGNAAEQAKAESLREQLKLREQEYNLAASQAKELDKKAQKEQDRLTRAQNLITAEQLLTDEQIAQKLALDDKRAKEQEELDDLKEMNAQELERLEHKRNQLALDIQTAQLSAQALRESAAEKLSKTTGDDFVSQDESIRLAEEAAQENADAAQYEEELLIYQQQLDLLNQQIEAKRNLQDEDAKIIKEAEEALSATEDELKALQDLEDSLEGSKKQAVEVKKDFLKMAQDLQKVKLNGEMIDVDGFKEQMEGILSKIDIPDTVKNELRNNFKDIGTMGEASFEEIWLAFQQMKEDLESEGVNVDVSTEGLEALIQNINQLQEAEDGMERTIGNIKELSEDAQGSAQKFIESIINSAASLVIVGETFGNITGEITYLIEEAADGTLTFSDFADSIATIGAQLIAGVPAAIDFLTGIKGMKENLDGAASDAYKLATALIAEGKAQDASTASRTLGTLAGKAQTLVNGLLAGSFKAEKIAAVSATVATEGFTAALLASPLFPIIAALMALGAAFLAVKTIISAVTSANEKHREHLAELAQAEREVAEEQRSLAETTAQSSNAVDEQNQKIEEANKILSDSATSAKEKAEAEQQIAQAQGDLITIGDDLIKTLEESSSSWAEEQAQEIKTAQTIAELTGEYGQLTEAIKKANEEALKDSVRSGQNSVASAGDSFIAEMRNGTGRYDGGKYLADIGGGASAGDETKARNAVSEGEFEHIKLSGNGLQISSGQSASEMARAYEEALRLQSELQVKMTDKERQDSEVYQNLTEWLDKSAEAYDLYANSVDDATASSLELLALDPESWASSMRDLGKDISLSEDDVKALTIPEGGFKSLSDYDAYKEKLKEIGDQAGLTEEQIEAFLGANSDTAEMASVESYIEQQTDALKEQQQALKDSGQTSPLLEVDPDQYAKDLKDLYDSLSDEDKILFAQVVPEIDPENFANSAQEQLAKARSLKLAADVTLRATDATYGKKQKAADELETGDTVSSDDFENLFKGYEQYFKLMEDGTYQLIEDSELLANQIESQRQKMLVDDAVKTATDAQQYKGTDSDTYSTMMEASTTSQQQFLASADSLRELNDLYATLKQSMAEAGIDSVSYTAFSQALIGLASQFDNTSQECAAYQEALRNGDKEQIKIAESALRAATIIGESAEKYGLNAKSLEIQAQEMKEANKEMNLSDEQAAQMAVTNQRLNKGITTLAKNWKDWSKQLKSADKTSQDFSDTAADLSDAVADIVGWYEELNLSSKFIDDNFELIESAANGNQKAILQLGNAVAQESIANAELDKSLVSAYGPFTSTQELAKGTASAFEELWSKQEKWISSTDMFTQVQGAVAEGFNKISGSMDELLSGDKSLADVLGGPEDLAAFVENLNAYAAATGMTAQQMQQMLSSVGVTANVTTDYVEQDVEVPTYYEDFIHEGNKPFTYTDEDGNSVTTYRPRIRKITVPGKPMKTKGYVGVARIDMEGADGSSSGVPPLQFTGKTAPSSSAIKGGDTGGGGSSGGGSKTPVKKVQKTEKKDRQRYTDNENAVEDVTNALDRLSKANEHAFGPQKIRNINLMNIQLARQAKAYQALYDEAKMYTKLDALSLDSGLAEFNAKYGTALKAEYDGDNLLNNEMELLNIITDLQNAKIAEINAVEDELNKLADKGVLQDDPQVDALNKQLETLKENLSALDTDVESMVKKNLDNYQEAIRKAEETMQAMVDILYRGLANEIEKYTIARDLHLQINELEQKHWEAIMNNMGAVGKMGKKVADMLQKSLNSINDSVGRYTKHYAQMEEVQKRWENRDITLKAEYGITDEVWDRAQQSGMIPQEIMDEFAGDIDALMDLRQQVWDNLDKQWQNYIDTIQHYIDEYDRITDRLDKQASISDNLMHVIETVGFNYKWGTDEGKSYYKNMETQLDIVKNKAAAVNGELAIATNRRKEAEEELNKLLAGRSVMEFSNSANEAEMFEYNRIKEHYDDMASLEAELNAQRVELLAQAYDKAAEYAEKWGEIIAHEADEALNGAFDTLDEAMDMYNQKRNIDTFFMDDVDKAFELNKLKREVEDVIDDISDPEQLERYNKLLAEIEAKKEAGVKMTEKDLEILRAQFDLEQARDAYQDARNAKNTMRLTRDASGNYTYVYSEDEQNVEDQEAKVEEAMHNIYKMNRDAADEYAETWLQLQVDWENYYRSIDQARYEQDVKYRDMVDQRMKWYAEQSDLLSNEIMKHNDSIDRSFTDMTLSVITNTEDMASTNDMYKEHHTQLKEKLVQNYQEWIEKADETMREVGGSMSDLEQVVDEETDKMMTEVDNLREEIDTLNVEAQSALGDLAGYIGTWCNDVNREFDTVIAEIDRLIQKYLEMLRVMSQKADAAVSAGSYDKGTDYNAYMSIDYQRYKDANGKLSPTEWLEKFHRSDIEERILAGADRGIAAGTTYEEALKIMAQEVVDNLGYDSSKGYNYGGSESKKELNNYIEINGDVVVQPKAKAATGGLFNSPNITGIAEEGPELVLNNADTENILNAVKAIRGIVQSQIGAVELGMIGKTGRIADIAPFIPKSENQSVDQTVHIDASFPGVSAAAEIETALNNLIVQAAHYSLNNKQN